jgi:hypothetical protein
LPYGSFVFSSSCSTSGKQLRDASGMPAAMLEGTRDRSLTRKALRRPRTARAIVKRNGPRHRTPDAAGCWLKMASDTRTKSARVNAVRLPRERRAYSNGQKPHNRSSVSAATNLPAIVTRRPARGRGRAAHRNVDTVWTRFGIAGVHCFAGPGWTTSERAKDTRLDAREDCEQKGTTDDTRTCLRMAGRETETTIERVTAGRASRTKRRRRTNFARAAGRSVSEIGKGPRSSSPLQYGADLHRQRCRGRARGREWGHAPRMGAGFLGAPLGVTMAGRQGGTPKDSPADGLGYPSSNAAENGAGTRRRQPRRRRTSNGGRHVRPSVDRKHGTEEPTRRGP